MGEWNNYSLTNEVFRQRALNAELEERITALERRVERHLGVEREGESETRGSVNITVQQGEALIARKG